MKYFPPCTEKRGFIPSLPIYLFSLVLLCPRRRKIGLTDAIFFIHHCSTDFFPFSDQDSSQVCEVEREC